MPANPSLADLLNLFKKEIKLEFNCHHVGTIQSYNEAVQTAQATINYPKTTFQTADDGSLSAIVEQYPQLLDCPVVCLGGGGGSLTFPITKGDECLVLFNDRDFDNWYQGGGTGTACATARLHSFSDGIIIVGVRSLANVIKTYDAVRAVLQLGTALVGVGGGGGTKVLVGNGVFTLNGLLQTLITDLQTMATGASTNFTAQATASTGPLAPLAPGFTALAAVFTAFNMSIATLSTQVAGLLE